MLVATVVSFCFVVQSAITLYNDKAAYPLMVELNSKGHAVEAIEVPYDCHVIVIILSCGFSCYLSGALSVVFNCIEITSSSYINHSSRE